MHRLKGLLDFIQNGILEEEETIEERVQVYGTNKPIVKKSKTFCEMVVDNFKDTTLQILSGAAIVSLALGVYTQGWRLGWL